MEPIAFRIEDELLDRIDGLADVLITDRSKLIRAILNDGVSRLMRGQTVSVPRETRYHVEPAEIRKLKKTFLQETGK